MKKHWFTPLVLGLAWLTSLGIVFVLGILSAFAFHLKPGAGLEGESLETRRMALVIETILDEPADLAAIHSRAHRDRVPAQVRRVLHEFESQYHPGSVEPLLRDLATGLPSRKRAAMVPWLLERPASPSRDMALRVFLKEWGRDDGRGALALAVRFEDRDFREWAVQAILSGWSQSRVSDAWSWARNSTGDPDLLSLRLSEVIWQAGFSDPDRALDLLHEVAGEEFAYSLAVSLVDALIARYGAADAMRRFQEMPEWAQDAAYSIAIRTWASEDPDQVLRSLEGADPMWMEVALEPAISAWVRVAPAAAMEWVGESLSGTARDRYLAMAADGWLDLEGPGPLSRWLNERNRPEDYDAAIKPLALAIMDDEPTTALSWVQVMGSSTDRLFYESLIAKRWLERSPAEAYSYLNENLLDAYSRMLVLGQIPEQVVATLPRADQPGGAVRAMDPDPVEVLANDLEIPDEDPDDEEGEDAADPELWED